MYSMQRRHTDGQWAHKKMLNLTSHQGNANQNFNEVPSHTNQNGHHQKSTNILLEGVWRKGNPPTLLVGM